MRLRLLLLELGDLRTGGGDLGGGVGDVEIGAEAAAEAVLGELERLLRRLDVLLRDLDRALGADQIRTLATLGGQVNRVDVAFTPSGIDSPFYNSAGLAGKVEHLPLDSSVSQNGGLTFGDISGNNRNATCVGNACPSANQSGHLGSAVAFDGVDDVLRIARPVQDDFTIALWAKSTQVFGNDSGIHQIPTYTGDVASGYSIALNVGV